MRGPGQTLDAWAAELERGDRPRRRPSVALPAHHRGGHAVPCPACGEETRSFPTRITAADLYAVTQEVTAARGLPAYEISNHARPGAESRHNLTYWRYGEYVGVGPGAHGRFVENGSAASSPSPKRCRRPGLNLVEARGHGITGGETLTRSEETDEFLLMGLRLAEGIDLARYEVLSGRPFSAPRLSILRGRGADRAGRQFAAARHAERDDRARRGGRRPGAVAKAASGGASRSSSLGWPCAALRSRSMRSLASFALSTACGSTRAKPLLAAVIVGLENVLDLQRGHGKSPEFAGK